MYDKLARGHATAYLNSLPTHEHLIAWFDSPRGARALDAFERSCRSKKPGRVLKRMAPPLRPVFGRPYILNWTRQRRTVAASACTVAPENKVFCLPQDAQPLYAERAALHTDVIFRAKMHEEYLGNSTLTAAAISHHALARLLERGAMVPDDMARDIPALLRQVTVFAAQMLRTRLDPNALQSFLLPYWEGALVAGLDGDGPRIGI